MTRTEIIKHYKSFFGLEELKMGENDYLMIDWVDSLLKDKAEVNNGVLDDVIICEDCNNMKKDNPRIGSGLCENCFDKAISEL